MAPFLGNTADHLREFLFARLESMPEGGVVRFATRTLPPCAKQDVAWKPQSMRHDHA
jgi:hypothetical protein